MRALALILLLLFAPQIARAGEMVESKLYFGLSSADGTINKSEWKKFVAEAITPRFPGLTIINAKGQYKDKLDSITVEDTKLVIIVHADSEQAKADLAAIRAEYKKRFSQESVFQTDSKVDVVE